MKRFLFIIFALIGLTVEASAQEISFANGDGLITISYFQGKKVVKLSLITKEMITINPSCPLVLYSNTHIAQFLPVESFESNKINSSKEKYNLEAYYSGNLDYLSKYPIKKLCINIESDILCYENPSSLLNKENSKKRSKQEFEYLRNYERENQKQDISYQVTKNTETSFPHAVNSKSNTVISSGNKNIQASSEKSTSNNKESKRYEKLVKKILKQNNKFSSYGRKRPVVLNFYVLDDRFGKIYEVNKNLDITLIQQKNIISEWEKRSDNRNTYGINILPGY